MGNGILAWTSCPTRLRVGSGAGPPRSSVMSWRLFFGGLRPSDTPTPRSHALSATALASGLMKARVQTAYYAERFVDNLGKRFARVVRMSEWTGV